MIQNLVNKAKQIHFIGVGGIGMSGLAMLLHESGKVVSGSDLNKNSQINFLKKENLKIFIGHKAEQIQAPDLVIKSFAIPQDNPELIAAQEKNIPILDYPQALGEFTNAYKLIAVAGTHGKTTTTGMLSKILIDANLDPTILIGSTTPHLDNRNYRKGKSEWMLIEACEYHSGFLNFNPYITLITNLEHDHFDAYPTEESYLEAFQKLINKTQHKSIINRDLDLSLKLKSPIENLNFKAGDLKFRLKAIGDHNNTNAIGAFYVGRSIGIAPEKIKKSLSEFQGTKRRMEIKKETDKQIFIDDYGHHPSEIKAVLSALKTEYPNKKIALIFQAHQHGRTIALLNDFTHSFQKADKVIIPNIYKARDSQAAVEQMSAKHFAEEIQKEHQNTIYTESLENTKTNLNELTQGYDIVLSMGAGDVYKILED